MNSMTDVIYTIRENPLARKPPRARGYLVFQGSVRMNPRNLAGISALNSKRVYVDEQSFKVPGNLDRLKRHLKNKDIEILVD